MNNPWDAAGPLAQMNSSQQSFFSEMNQEQQDGLKKHTSKPFVISKKASGQNFYASKQEEDLLSEISMPELDNAAAERRKILEALERREKDREELELDSTFKSLLGKAQGVNSQQVENMARDSASDFRKSGNMNIFKPNLRQPTGTTPRPPSGNQPMKALPQPSLHQQQQ